MAGSNSFRALKAFSLNERGAIRELVTGCRVLEDCLGCCVSEVGLQWEDCVCMLRTGACETTERWLGTVEIDDSVGALLVNAVAEIVLMESRF